MKPYYSESGITIYHGDCREILPHLGPVDLVLTDPPYKSLDIDVVRGSTTRLVDGRNYRGGDRVGSGAWFSTLGDDELCVFMSGIYSSLPDHAALYIFSDVKTGLRIFPSLPIKNVLVWDKVSIGMGYSWRRMHEWVGFCPRSEHRLRDKGFGDILRAQVPENKCHPTEKPCEVLQPIILNSTDPGATILDPFMGSGTTLRAAKDLGRKCIGIEISREYCDIAIKRLQQETLPLQCEQIEKGKGSVQPSMFPSVASVTDSK